jgi:lipoprotein-anchoring transpeptidase ErfK/SrfK
MLSAPLFCSAASAQTLGYAPAQPGTFPQGYATSAPVAESEESVLPERLRRATVNFETREASGTVIIDTGNTVLYYVLGGGRAIRYGVGVGRQGFTWSGVQTISRKAEWPDWYPPAEMVARQPYLPRFVAGGPGNPLGARAMYLGSSEFRIHGTNDPTTIGKFVSSGCIRMTNEDVSDLFSRVDIGTKVVVLPKNAPLEAKARGAATGTGTGTTTVRPTPAQARPAVTTLPSGRQVMTVSTSAIY